MPTNVKKAVETAKVTVNKLLEGDNTTVIGISMKSGRVLTFVKNCSIMQIAIALYHSDMGEDLLKAMLIHKVSHMTGRSSEKVNKKKTKSKKKMV